MNRMATFMVFCLLPLVAGEASSGSAVFRIFVYAPMQESSPLHIVGVQYDEGFIRLSLSNRSDKPIAGVSVVAVEVAPPRCGAEPRRRIRLGGSVEVLHIQPHATVVTPGRGHSPSFPASALITNAQRLEAASLHVQMVVLGVDFVDGTKWRSREQLPQTPFDSSLVESDAGKCADAAAVTRALGSVAGFEFDRGLERPSTGGKDEAPTLPRLFFSCNIERAKAVCPSP